jgi:hypothetical protein
MNCLESKKNENKKNNESETKIENKKSETKIENKKSETKIENKKLKVKIDDEKLEKKIDNNFERKIDNNFERKIDNNSQNNLIPKFILDPLSVIIKLAILSKKDLGCKLSIYNNILYFQEPGIFQPLVRYLFNNNKNDLNYLYNPIEIACKLYLVDNKDNLDIKILFINAQKGLQNLISNYNNSKIIVHTLYMYYNLIANYLTDNYNKDLFIKDDISLFYSNDLIDKLNKIWTCDKIKIVLNIIQFIDYNKETEYQKIKCIDEFMVQIDNDISKIINSIE